MKKSEKISAISGISLLVVAALFLVALLLQLIPFANRDAAPLLNGLGGLLYGAYGYSSLLIPAFSLQLAWAVFFFRGVRKSECCMLPPVFLFLLLSPAKRCVQECCPWEIVPWWGFR